MFEIVLNQVGRRDTNAMALVGTTGRTDSHRIAVAHHTVGLLQVQLLAILAEKHELLDFTISGIDGYIAGHTTHIGETLLIVVVTGYQHVSQFLTRYADLYGIVLEGVHLHNVANSHIACGMAIDTYATGILIRQVGTRLSHIGIADHTAQLLVVVKRRLSNSQHTSEGWILREITHQFGEGRILVALFVDGDTLSLLADNLAILQHQRSVRGILQTLLILRNQDAVVYLATFQLGV